MNVEPNPIEAIYMFPIEEEAAVISFEAEMDDRKIITEIREKQEARQDYDKASQNMIIVKSFLNLTSQITK